MKLPLLLLGVLLIACGDDTDLESCPEGDLGCPCIDDLGNLCWDAYTCVSDVCVDLSEVTSTSTGGDTCWSSEVCAEDELCYEGGCWFVEDLNYSFTVNHFDPSSCGDGWGSAEPYFKYYMDGYLQEVSGETSCPAGWDLELDYSGGHDFKIEFFESDAVTDDFYGTLSWSEGVVPAEHLRSGYFSGNFGPEQSHFAHLEFTVVGTK